MSRGTRITYPLLIDEKGNKTIYKMEKPQINQLILIPKRRSDELPYKHMYAQQHYCNIILNQGISNG